MVPVHILLIITDTQTLTLTITLPASRDHRTPLDLQMIHTNARHGSATCFLRWLGSLHRVS